MSNNKGLEHLIQRNMLEFGEEEERLLWELEEEERLREEQELLIRAGKEGVAWVTKIS